MSTALAQLAAEINDALGAADVAEGTAKDQRVIAGQKLMEAKRLVEAGESNLPWSLWCEANIKRSQRDIRKLLNIAAAPDPDAAAKAEKQRNRDDAKAKRERERIKREQQERSDVRPAAGPKPFEAHDMGVGASLRGVTEKDCPFTSKNAAAHAAWRKGFAEQQERTTREQRIDVAYRTPTEIADDIRALSSEDFIAHKAWFLEFIGGASTPAAAAEIPCHHVKGTCRGYTGCAATGECQAAKRKVA